MTHEDRAFADNFFANVFGKKPEAPQEEATVEELIWNMKHNIKVKEGE